jgi:hypothetical protein
MREKSSIMSVTILITATLFAATIAASMTIQSAAAMTCSKKACAESGGFPPSTTAELKTKPQHSAESNGVDFSDAITKNAPSAFADNGVTCAAMGATATCAP